MVQIFIFLDLSFSQSEQPEITISFKLTMMMTVKTMMAGFYCQQCIDQIIKNGASLLIVYRLSCTSI